MAILSTEALPNLRNAILTWGAAEHIVPNRPIVGLAILQQRQSEVAVAAGLAKLAQSTGPLQILSIDFLSIKYNIFPLIANTLPLLRELSVGMTLGDGSDFDEWLSERETSVAFHMFRALASIRLRVSKWKKLGADRRALVEGWGAACPTLKDVKFYTFRPPVSDRPVFAITYRRMEQDTGVSVSNEWTRLEV
ncbi:hypothetical protein CALVIDRAFT_568933 [Calocera viscosa TUFC12733]|uniref:Uncharacterized protein n=1 Tax=Calocera viscosa (strain TUFC12733) TaxID=1330018 RepID=A0A167GIM8_CALVF|nr:hypothetical protein CALVIDRAFT_568933 [Calocera viscosa TUFC12733]